MNNYVSVIYDKNIRPLTSYPEKLSKYLFKKYSMNSGNLFLEPGCGRGEFLHEFKKLGLNTFACDLSKEACLDYKDQRVDLVNIENETLPYSDNFFDFIYTKSVLEHLHSPVHFLKECFRVLKPGGRVVFLVPDWESNYKIYFDDFTHVTPYTLISLSDALKMAGFTDCNVEKFRQLPLNWKYPSLNVVSKLIAPFVPNRSKVKFFRWSKELMLLGSGKKE